MGFSVVRVNDIMICFFGGNFMLSVCVRLFICYVWKGMRGGWDELSWN